MVENINSANAKDFEPAYIKLHKSGELRRRAEELLKSLKECRLCPRDCGVDRRSGKVGVCRAPYDVFISSFHPHFGEEPPLVGSYGSGTIFFTHCSLRCVFCINYEISHLGEGYKISFEELAKAMLILQKQKGCHNINVVTPTHYMPHILMALDIAASKGLSIPIVYNTCGWEKVEILKYLDGVVDIYLPDFKYYNSEMSNKYSAGAADYPDVTKKAILEMHRQVGVLKMNHRGIAQRGLMIRHLVMPNNVSGSKDVLRWISENLPKDTYINIMSQYTPLFKAKDYPEINRRITRAEYFDVVEEAKRLGFSNLEIQGM
ncbi:MAG: radical SAM protein [Deltaproteobacteria bacterium]|nr:radical SAM protein [Deltaproteobacteria bacterium]